MQRVKNTVAILTVLLGTLTAQGQNTPLSIGMSLGGSNYLGEIGGKFDPRASLLDVDIITTALLSNGVGATEGAPEGALVGAWREQAQPLQSQ